MKSLLKLLSIDLIFEFVGEFLAGTIKNQDSAKAQRILGAVRKLDRIVSAFLARFDPEAKPRFFDN